MNETTQIDSRVEDAAPAFESAAAQAPAVAGAAADAAPGWFRALAEPRLAIPLILTLGALMFVLNLGGYPLYTKGEPREAVTILNMVKGGGLILPMRAGLEIPSKPLLMHWLGAMVSLALGRVDEWSVRLPSALLAIAGLLVCYGYVRRLFDDLTALLSALILGSTVQYLQAGSGARVDMTLTFFMEVAFFEFLMMAEGLTRRRALLYVSIALAVLAKGPVGLVLPAAVAAVWIAAQGRWTLFGEISLGRGALIVSVLAGSWYVAASVVGGKAFIEKQIIAENLVRLFGGQAFHEGHAHPFYYLELALFGGFMPWTPLLALVGWRSVRDPRRTEPRLMYLLIWFAVVLVVYSLARSKRGVYLLGLYPALATLVALYLSDAVSRPAASARLVRALSTAAGITFLGVGGSAMVGLAFLWRWPGAFSAILALFDITDPDFVTALGGAITGHLVFSLVLPIAVCGLGGLLVASQSTGEKMALSFAAGMALIASAANVVVVPATASALTLKRFAAEVTVAVDGHPLAYLGWLDYGVAFYLGRNIPIVGIDDRTDYVMCWRRVYESMRPETRAQYQIVLTSNPTSLDNTGRMVLLKHVGAAPPGHEANV